MEIKIKDRTKCESCKKLRCTFANAVLKANYYSLRSESTICPVGYLIDRPTEITDNDAFDTKICIKCGLCVLECPYDNLYVKDFFFNTETFDNLTEQQYNAIALSYLHNMFEFATNTNRNASIDFDGYVETSQDLEAFVEVDYGNDSLESCRRLLGDFLSYKGQFDEEVNYGIIVLRNFPECSRDIYSLIKNIGKFPLTKNKRIYITTRWRN